MSCQGVGTQDLSAPLTWPSSRKWLQLAAPSHGYTVRPRVGGGGSCRHQTGSSPPQFLEGS